ncbi:chemotaxis protein CheW [Thiomicrospira microaerophila]|uniref:chemotaxis protein CheW n=1 Tax=Thiomicrospira microaerophila TaxID=406020 RepID=UPI0005CB4157|nr:chemotaxis protein CheW [Thiomicrospira microaerophila]
MSELKDVEVLGNGVEQFLSFILGQETYGLNILRVQEIRGWEPTTKLPGMPSYVKGVINIRGAVVPIVDMRERFQIGEPSYDESTVVIITRMIASQSDGVEKVVGLVVDGVSDVEDVDLNQLQNAPSFSGTEKVNEEFIKGLASRDHKMIILLDVDRLLNQGVLGPLSVKAA